jgi:hypothetical protein
VILITHAAIFFLIDDALARSAYAFLRQIAGFTYKIGYLHLMNSTRDQAFPDCKVFGEGLHSRVITVRTIRRQSNEF